MPLTNEHALLFQKYLFWRSVTEMHLVAALSSSDMHKQSNREVQGEEKNPNTVKERVYTGRIFLLLLFIPLIGCDLPGILVFTSFSYYYYYKQ